VQYFCTIDKASYNSIMPYGKETLAIYAYLQIKYP
jgi:hypothetical protein